MAEVGIIIPAYNAEAYLAQSIESVIAQTYQDWQLIVLDDGSRDASFTIAERYAWQDARIQVYKQANTGVAATRNNGFKRVGSEVSSVLFLDNDDYLEQDALMVLRSVLLSSPDAVAAYGLPRDVDGKGEPITIALSEAYGFKRPTISSSNFLTPEQKNIARLGHLYSCLYKLSWVKEDVRRKNFFGAGKTIYRVLKSYMMYLRTPYGYASPTGS